MKLKSWLLALLLTTPAAALAADAGDDTVLEAGGVALEHGKAATADASPVDAGATEIEFGYAPMWNNRGGRAGFEVSEAGHAHAFAGTLTRGLVPNVDLKLSAGFGSVYEAAHLHPDGSAPTHGSGLSDVAFGARWRFLSLAAHALELAATADGVAPSGTRCSATRIGLSQEYWSARGALVASKDLGPVTSNLELGLEAPVSGDAGGLRSVAQVNAAVGYQLRPWLQPELELNYEAAIGLDAQVLAVTGGLVAPFGNGHRLVAAVQQGVWGRNSGQTTAAVFSFKTAL